jgi:hypothetical protein
MSRKGPYYERLLLLFPKEKITVFRLAIFYPAMLENEEDNKIKLLVHNQDNFRFGLSPRHARSTNLFNIGKKEKPMSLFRRLTVHVLLALMLFVGVSPVAAAPAVAHEVVTGPAEFIIPADQCPLLPAGVRVEGSGESVAIINTRTLADGTMVVRINNLIKGDAIVSNDGVHKFVYHNSSTQTIEPDGFTTISMNDSFVLTGPGPHYSVTFNWRWTFMQPASENLWPPQGDDWVQISGDPDEIIFLCDPL